MNKTYKYILISIGLFLFIEVQVLVFVCVNSYIKDNNRFNQDESFQFAKTFDNKSGSKFNSRPDIDNDMFRDIEDSNNNSKSKNKTK